MSSAGISNSPLFSNAPNLETLTQAFDLWQLEAKRIATYKSLDRFDELLLDEYAKANSLPPAPQFITFFAYLPALPLNQIPEDERSCSICHEVFYGENGGEAAQKLPCGHLVGDGCIRKWLIPHGNATTCPMCRTPLLTPCDMTTEIIRHGHMGLSAESVNAWIWLDHLGLRVRCDHDRARVRVRRYQDVMSAHANAVEEYDAAMSVLIAADNAMAAAHGAMRALTREEMDLQRVLEVRRGVLDRVWIAMREASGRFDGDVAAARRFCDPERDARAQRRVEERLQRQRLEYQMALGRVQRGGTLLSTIEQRYADAERRVDRTLNELRDAQHELQQLSGHVTGMLATVRALDEEPQARVDHGAGPGALLNGFEEGVSGFTQTPRPQLQMALRTPMPPNNSDHYPPFGRRSQPSNLPPRLSRSTAHLLDDTGYPSEQPTFGDDLDMAD